MNKPKLGDMLLEANLIDQVQMEIALQEQKTRGTRFGSTLLALHFIDENVLTAFLARQLDIPCVSLSNIEIASRLFKVLPKEEALKYHVIPVREEGGKLFLAMCDPMDWETIESVEKISGLAVAPMVAPESSILECIERHYPAPEGAKRGIEDTGAGAFPDLIREIEETEVFGRHFGKLDARLERLEAALARIEGLLARGRGEGDE